MSISDFHLGQCLLFVLRIMKFHCFATLSFNMLQLRNHKKEIGGRGGGGGGKSVHFPNALFKTNSEIND